MTRRPWLIAALLCLVGAGSAPAVEPDEILRDPTLEARARAISSELRCLVCQNQSIDDSHATLARDLRLLVRERLTAGDSDGAVERFLVARYGDFVLLRPPLQPDTLLLWGLPFLVLGAGAVVAIAAGRRNAALASAPIPLDAAEEAEFQHLIGRP